MLTERCDCNGLYRPAQLTRPILDLFGANAEKYLFSPNMGFFKIEMLILNFKLRQSTALDTLQKQNVCFRLTTFHSRLGLTTFHSTPREKKQMREI